MATYFRLQDLCKCTDADMAQDWRDAVDIGAYSTLVVQKRMPNTGSGGTLVLQHAAVKEEEAFVDISSPTFNLTGANEVQEFTGLLRYVRWSYTSMMGGPIDLVIDVIAREH